MFKEHGFRQLPYHRAPGFWMVMWEFSGHSRLHREVLHIEAQSTCCNPVDELANEPGFCTNKGRDDNATLLRDFAPHCGAGRDLDFNHPSPSELYRRDLSDPGRADRAVWSLRPGAARK